MEIELDSITSYFNVAARLHNGQVDKAGQPYIYHLVRVALSLDDVFLQTVALLHDAIEDEKTTFEELEKWGMPVANIVILIHLTRRKDEEYFDYIFRCCEDRNAAKIKREDLRDNLSNDRPGNYKIDPKLRQRYERALIIVNGSLVEVQ